MFEAESDTYKIVVNGNAPIARRVRILYDIRDGQYYPLLSEKDRKKKEKEKGRGFYRKIPSLMLDFSHIGVEEERKKRERLAKEKETLIKATA